MTETGQIITASHPSDAQHWYYPDGRPAYKIIGKGGKTRSTTLADARKLGLLPGVSTITNEAAKPGLNNWEKEQVLLAALTLPRIDGEPEKEYVAHIITDSKAQAKKAAERGTQIHAWIQQGFEGRLLESEEALSYYLVVANLLDIAELGLRWHVEQSFSAYERYGGKVDLYQPGVVLDIKTKESPDKFALYDEHYKQLAAYREGLKMPHARCGIVFVSTTGKPETQLLWAEEKHLQRGWKMFQALLDHYYARTGLRHG